MRNGKNWQNKRSYKIHEEIKTDISCPYGNIISRPFIAAIVLAITGAPANQLMAVIFSIVFISVLFYAMGLMTRVLKKMTVRIHLIHH